MINIKGIPLLHEDDCLSLFTPEGFLSSYYFLKPKYKYLPDLKYIDEKEKSEYFLKDIKEGFYLIGLQVISDNWVNRGFCELVLTRLGLVLVEANPMTKKGNFGKRSLFYLNFKHIAFANYSLQISLSK